MKAVLYIAWRYLFSKSQQSVVNLITYITLLVIVVASAALLVVLSAFSGLKAFSTEYTLKNSADYTILASEEAMFEIEKSQLETLFNQGISVQAELKKQALIAVAQQTTVGYVISDPLGNYYETIAALYGASAPAADSVLINLELYRQFGVHPEDNTRISLSVPKRVEGPLRIALGGSALVNFSAQVSGVFQDDSAESVASVALEYEAARELFGLSEGLWVTQLALSAPEIDEFTLRELVSQLFGPTVIVRSRTETNAALFKLLNSEYVATYVIFSLILVLALFNLAGALSVVVLDKRLQLPVLKQLGLSPGRIRRVFFWLGWMQVAVGSLLGVLLGVLLVLSQHYFGWVKVSFDLPYPVELRGAEIALVLITLVMLGAGASLAAVRLSKPLRQL
ncbi:MAG: hypothetical protein RLZZ242_1404 [Bacteroidota bacterium]